jgi:glutamate-ammonia-ligase adenylyltransferase
MERIESEQLIRLVGAVFDGSADAGAAILRERDFLHPAAAFQDLARLLEPLGPGPFAEELADLLLVTTAESADRDMALANWERYFSVSFSPTNTAALLVGDPQWAENLSLLFGHSQYLAGILLLNPEYFNLLETAALARPKALDHYESEMFATLALFHEEETQRNALCRYQRRELLRTGMRDILGLAGLEGITAEISDLAQALIRVALAIVEDRVQARYGAPLCASTNNPCGFAVIAMGKFGGRELNYSSDVDLIFVYEEPGHTAGRDDGSSRAVNSISNQEYFAKLGAALIDFLSRPGPEGYLYRVDMRLRPEGVAGALAHSLAACQGYYLGRARLWEKIALLKARGVAGDPGLIKRFEELAAGFVFAPSDPGALLVEVARLKDSIDHEIATSANAHREIKRGTGGIREIEFIVAALEILYGHHRPRLRRKSTLAALEALAAERILSAEDARTLEAAYRFFRAIEHALQCMAWRQTHLLPTDEMELAALARRVGIRGRTGAESAALFSGQRAQLARGVHRLFDDLFRSTEDERGREDATALRILDRRLSVEQAASILARWRLRDPGAVESLRRLAYGTSALFVSAEGQRAFEQILPDFLESCRRVAWPESAVQNFETFIEASGEPAGYYGLFSENRALLDLLVRLFGTSRALSERLIANPGWVDPLISSETFDIDESKLRARGRRMGEPVEEGAPERLRALRDFAFLTNLRIGIRYIVGVSPTVETAALLTALADSCLEAATLWAIDDIYTRELSGPPGYAPPFAILGLGKLGRRELTFQSDLDVVFVADTAAPSPLTTAQMQMLFPRLAERLIFYLTDASTGGTVFKIDARLRPAGGNSPLVTSLERLRAHFEAKPDVWEIQTYLGARVAAGDRALGKRALEHVMAAIPGLGDATRVAGEIRSMRARLEAAADLPAWGSADFKRGPGGLVDLEFLAQFLQIAHSGELPSIVSEAPCGVFEAAGSLGWLVPDDVAALRDDYTFLRALETDVRLLFESQHTTFPTDRARLEALVHAPNRKVVAGEVLRTEFDQRTRRVRALFERILQTN